MLVSFCVSDYVCLFVCLFVCLAVTLLGSLYLLSVFTVIVSFDFVIQPLFLSIITKHFLFHFLIRPFGENSRRWNWVVSCTPTRCMGKPFKVSINYFILFALQKVSFCFSLSFNLPLATTSGIDFCLRLSFDIIMMASGQGM